MQPAAVVKKNSTVDPKHWVDSRRVFEEHGQEEQGQTHDVTKH